MSICEVEMGTQLSFFPMEDNKIVEYDVALSQSTESPAAISERLINEFDVMIFPFIGCDFETVYPQIASIIPKENVDFSEYSIEIVTMAEIISAGICHQINWDFLRSTILKKIKHNEDWLLPNNLININESTMEELLNDYEKKERIRASERAEMVKEIAAWVMTYPSPKRIFLDDENKALPVEVIHDNAQKCSVFSRDPEEKKYQLLLQKLSAYPWFKELANYSKPAVDYHLIRCYIRRGLIYPKTNRSSEFITNSESIRKESTVAALRHLCAEVMIDLSGYTNLDICTINQIEWHIGRSVCIEGNPDCELKRSESNWLKGTFSKCPFSSTCARTCYRNKFNGEPNYKGDSF